MRHSLDQFIRYRDIVLYRTLAGLKAESRQSFLGYIWFVLEPAITTAIMYVMTVVIMNTKGVQNVVFLLLGTITWQWFESAINAGMMGIRTKLHIMSHFKLPKYIFPLVGIFTTTWKFLCVFIVVLVFCAICGYRPNIHYLYLPVVMLVQLSVIIGLAVPLAIIVTYFADMTTVTSSIFRLLYFLSGAFFTPEKVPENLRMYFYANPMAGLIESYRNIVLSDLPPNMNALLYGLVFGGFFILLGLVWSRHVDGKILKRVNG